MRQEKFTEQAQEVLALSQEMVRRYGHSQYDVEHILLALLEQPSGLTEEILKELGVQVQAVRQRVERALVAVDRPEVRAGLGELLSPTVAVAALPPADLAARLCAAGFFPQGPGIRERGSEKPAVTDP